MSTPSSLSNNAAGLPAPETGSAEKLALRRFRVVFNAVKTHFQQVEKQAGIGGAQIWALSVIGQNPGIRISGLGAAMDIHQSTASNLVRVLVERSLVGTSKNSEDRRAVQLTLLPAGESLLEKAPGPFAGVLPAALGRLNQATLERLNEDLGRLIEALAHEDAADPSAEKIPLASL